MLLNMTLALAVLQNVSVPGHMDGLKINPRTGDVWATENEDGNPTLAIIEHESGEFKVYTFNSTLITGGMDDLVLTGPESSAVFVVTSSKAFTVLSTQVGNPSTVWNVVTNAAETTDQIGDPDSMTLDPAGELVLDNRSDKSLYIVRASGVTNPVLRVPLTLSGSPVEVNDTIFTTSTTSGVASSAGTVFITDTTANAIYMLSKTYFPSNEVYTAANLVGDVGLVDLSTGVVTPVVTGFQGVHGLAFAPNSVAIVPVETNR
jgi:hypothetical protein